MFKKMCKMYVLNCMVFFVIYFHFHNRYRNFRTFTSPRPSQFSCLAVDSSGEIVSAGSQDSFEIYIWSMQSGRLLDVRTHSVLEVNTEYIMVILSNFAISWRTLIHFNEVFCVCI